MERSDVDVDEFIEGLPDDVREDIKSIDGAIAPAMKGLPRELYVGKFWGGSDQQIIGYGLIASPRSDGSTVEWFIVGLAVQKNYLSVYISAVEDGEYLSEKYGSEVGKVKVGKSNISFKSVSDIDLVALTKLVARARELSVA